MEHNFHLTDEKVNNFEMPLGNELYRASHQIMLCKKNVFPEKRFAPDILDVKKSISSFVLYTEGEDYWNSFKEIDIELNHIAFIDSQIKIIFYQYLLTLYKTISLKYKRGDVYVRRELFA